MTLWGPYPSRCQRCGATFDEGCEEWCLDKAIQTRIDEMASPEVTRLIEELEDELAHIERRAQNLKELGEIPDYSAALLDCAVQIRRVIAGKKNTETSQGAA